MCIQMNRSEQKRKSRTVTQELQKTETSPRIQQESSLGHIYSVTRDDACLGRRVVYRIQTTLCNPTVHKPSLDEYHPVVSWISGNHEFMTWQNVSRAAKTWQGPGAKYAQKHNWGFSSVPHVLFDRATGFEDFHVTPRATSLWKPLL